MKRCALLIVILTCSANCGCAPSDGDRGSEAFNDDLNEFSEADGFIAESAKSVEVGAKLGFGSPGESDEYDQGYRDAFTDKMNE